MKMTDNDKQELRNASVRSKMTSLFSFTDANNAKGIFLSVCLLLLITTLIIISRKSGDLFSNTSFKSFSGSGLIFLSGLIAGVHCVGMCGSFIITYVSRDAERGKGSLKSHLGFSAGKIISYTFFGAAFGALGTLFTITPIISGISVSLAGTFLLIYGISMLRVFNLFRFMKIRQPEILNGISDGKRNALWHPLLLGLSSGLLIGCGPLQAMYILAAGNANVVDGARILFLFAVGTLPTLMAFGFITRKLSSAIEKDLLKFSGIIIIVLGIIMLNKGISKAVASDKNNIVAPSCNCSKAQPERQL